MHTLKLLLFRGTFVFYHSSRPFGVSIDENGASRLGKRLRTSLFKGRGHGEGISCAQPSWGHPTEARLVHGRSETFILRGRSHAFVDGDVNVQGEGPASAWVSPSCLRASEQQPAGEGYMLVPQQPLLDYGMLCAPHLSRLSSSSSSATTSTAASKETMLGSIPDR